MTAAIMPASLQHVEKSREIGIYIGMRMIDRVANTGLGGEMHHRLELAFCKECGDRLALGKVHQHEGKAWIRIQVVQPRAFQRWVVVAVEAVQPDDMPAFRQQLPRDVKADEPRRTRDQYCPFRHHVPKQLSAVAAPAGASLAFASGIPQHLIAR